MNRAATITKGLAALVLLAALAAGIPWALWHFIGWPLPHHFPRWNQLSADLSQHGIADTTLLKALACVVWLAWAVLIASLAVEIPAAMRGRAARVAVGGPLQPMVAQLLTAVAIAALSITPRPPSGGPQPLTVALGSGPAARPAPAVALAVDTPPPAITTAGLADSIVSAASPPAGSAQQELPGYVVQRNDTLWGIAERELGDPLRWRDIYTLNQDRPQPDGRRLIDPHWIDPGWTLLLPPATPAQTADSPPDTDTAPVPEGASSPGADSVGTGPAATSADPDAAAPYTVHPGDSLWEIASDRLGAGEDWPSLWAANRDRPEPAGAALVDPSVILPGWQLTIPAHGAEQPAPLQSDPAHAQPTPVPNTPSGTAPVGGPEPVDGSVSRSAKPAAPGMELPGGYLVGGAMAMAAGAALGVARLHRRRRRAPTDPAPAIAWKDPLNRPTIDKLVRRHDNGDQRGDPEPAGSVAKPPAPGVIALGRYGQEELLIDLRGAVALVGDDSRIEVARAATLSLLAQSPDDTHVVIAGRDLAVRLLGETYDVAGLTVTDDLPGALRQAEVELVSRNRILDQLEVPDADTLAQQHPEERFTATVLVAAGPFDVHGARLGAVLSAGRHLALGGLLVDRGPTAATIEVGANRQLIEVAPHDHHLGGSLGGELYGLGAAQAGEIVSALAASRGRIADDDTVADVAFSVPDPPERATIEVKALGGFGLYACSGTEVTGLREKAKELLAYLLLNPDGVPADRAMEALWPEVDPHKGRDRFRTVLSNLRGQLAESLGELSPPPVERIGPVCRVDPAAVNCDLWRFQAALTDARDAATPDEKRTAYARAADAYGGDLLDGADCSWVEPPREKLRDLAVGALCRLAELAQAAGDDDAAAAALERAVDLDPYGEETARRLIGLHGQSGNADAARRVYRRLSRVLQDDLDVDPSPQTRRLLEGILQRSRTDPRQRI